MKMNEEEIAKKKRVYKVLVVDDEKDIVEALKWPLERAEEFDCDVTTATNPLIAMTDLESTEFDIVLADFKMPIMDGVELLTRIKDTHPNTIRMLITGYSDMTIAKDAINRAHVYNFIMKPWNNKELKDILSEALKRKNEREKGRITEVDEANEALKLVGDLKDHVLNEQKLMFSFASIPDLNRFSFEIKKMKNVHIKDFHVFESKYIISVVILPELFNYLP